MSSKKELEEELVKVKDLKLLYENMMERHANLVNAIDICSKTSLSLKNTLDCIIDLLQTKDLINNRDKTYIRSLYAIR